MEDSTKQQDTFPTTASTNQMNLSLDNYQTTIQPPHTSRYQIKIEASKHGTNATKKNSSHTFAQQ